MIWIVLPLSIIIALVIITPFVIKAVLNSAINKKIGDYRGKIGHLTIGLFSGKIGIRNLTLHSITPVEKNKTILQVPIITIEFKWTQLFKKILDLNITVHEPNLRFVSEEPTEEPAETAAPNDQHLVLKEVLEKLISFKATIHVIEGEIQYVNPHTAPNWEVTIHRLNVHIHDFSNRIHLSDSCRVGCDFQLCDGTGDLNLIVHPLASDLTLALDFELKSINLVLLNGLFRAYGKVDLNAGTLNLYGKVTIAENAIKGHINPILHDLDFISRADRNDTLFQKIWERIVAGLFAIFFRHRNGSLGTIIPIDGRLDDPQLRDGAAILAILRKTTIKALTPTVDIKSLWQRVRSQTKTVIRGILSK